MSGILFEIIEWLTFRKLNRKLLRKSRNTESNLLNSVHFTGLAIDLELAFRKIQGLGIEIVYSN